jgi:methylmalonyl-CoA/ethylmalonyl-CoA epimerase
MGARLTLDHVGVVVRDLGTAAAAYRERFGMTVVGEEELPHLGVRVLYLAGGEGEPGVGPGAMVQLLTPIGPGGVRDHLATAGEGLHHLCYAVADIEAAAARLAPGAEVRINRGGRGRRACFLPGETAGVRIELTEAEPSFRVGEGV